MSIRSSRVVMSLNHRVLGQPSDMLVHPTKVHGRVEWQSLALTINFERRCANHLQRGISPEGLKRGDLSPRRAAHSPGLFQDARAPLAASVRPLSHIIVAA